MKTILKGLTLGLTMIFLSYDSTYEYIPIS